MFDALASLLVYQGLGLDPVSRLGSALHFFVMDTTKIFALLVIGFLFKDQLNRAFPSSPEFEKVAPWLLGTLLLVFLFLLFRGLLAHLGVIG